jgi:hypothetical protein
MDGAQVQGCAFYFQGVLTGVSQLPGRGYQPGPSGDIFAADLSSDAHSHVPHPRVYYHAFGPVVQRRHPKMKTSHPPSLRHPPDYAHARINQGWRGGSERAHSSQPNCSLICSTNPVGYSGECTSHYLSRASWSAQWQTCSLRKRK